MLRLKLIDVGGDGAEAFLRLSINFLKEVILKVVGLGAEFLLYLGVLLLEVLLALLCDDELAHIFSVFINQVLQGVGAHLSHQ